MTWEEFLKISHIVGTILGVGGATYVELVYRRARADGRIDESESNILRLMYSIMRFGLLLLVLSGFGFFLELRLNGPTFVLYLPNVWMKLTITGVLLLNAVMLQLRTIPAWLGGAVSIVGWYAASFLGIWRSLHPPYIVLILAYAVLVGVVAAWFKATDERRRQRA